MQCSNDFTNINSFNLITPIFKMRKLRLGKVKQLISSRYMISIDWLHSPCTQTNIPCSPILKTKCSRERTDLSSA